MKKILQSLLTLFLLYLPFLAFSQDYVKLKNGDVFNCKVISSDKDELIFKIDSVQKKIPMYLVDYVKFNEQTSNERITTLGSDSTKKESYITNYHQDSIQQLSLNHLMQAGIERKAALNTSLAAYAVLATGGTITIITRSPIASIVSGVIASGLVIKALVHNYKSANHLIEAGKELHKK